MWYMILRLSACLTKKAMKWKALATSAGSPGGATIVSEEWQALIPEIIDCVAQSFAMDREQVAMAMLDGASDYVLNTSKPGGITPTPDPHRFDR